MESGTETTRRRSRDTGLGDVLILLVTKSLCESVRDLSPLESTETCSGTGADRRKPRTPIQVGQTLSPLVRSGMDDVMSEGHRVKDRQTLRPCTMLESFPNIRRSNLVTGKSQWRGQRKREKRTNTTQTSSDDLFQGTFTSRV